MRTTIALLVCLLAAAAWANSLDSEKVKPHDIVLGEPEEVRADPGKVHLDSEPNPADRHRHQHGRGHQHHGNGQGKGHNEGGPLVPEPGTALLFGTGLLGLALLGRR